MTNAVLEQTVYVYNFDFLPDMRLTENKRKAQSTNYMAYHSMSTESREMWGWLFKHKRIPHFDVKVGLEWTVYFESWRSAYDPDNVALALKPVVDALKDVSVIRDDSGKYISHISYSVDIDKRKPDRTTLRIIVKE